MEKEITELIDEKIHNLHEIEDYLINITRNYDNAKFILSKIYHVINVQRKIDNTSLNEYEVI